MFETNLQLAGKSGRETDELSVLSRRPVVSNSRSIFEKGDEVKVLQASGHQIEPKTSFQCFPREGKETPSLGKKQSGDVLGG